MLVSKIAAALWGDFRVGREEGARARLVDHYLRHAHVIAAKLYRGRFDNSVPFEDYLQYARVGLLEAIDRFDPAREASFETFSSYRIRGAILNGLGTQSEWAAQRAHRHNGAQQRLESLRQEAYLGGARTDFEQLAQLTVGLALGELLERELEEPIDPAETSNPYAAAELSQLRHLLRAFVETLPVRERELIRRHYYGHEEFQAIAQDLGLTKGRISQLHAQALARIRAHFAGSRELDRRL